MASTPSTSSTEAAPIVLTVEHLKNSGNNLWYRVHVFIYDLHKFRERPDSLRRLDTIKDVSYLGSPYFTEDETAKLKAIAVHGGTQSLKMAVEKTLKERLERRMSKRVESGDYRVCAAHDLAPIFEKALDINWKSLCKDELFREMFNDCGLRLDGRSWDGIVARPKFGPRSKGKKGGNKGTRK